jgi:glyoxylase-like metal-dependent hydrolase (beta-lactamase superfamily II)
MTSPPESDRRTFLRQASVAAAVPAAAALLAASLPGTASAARSAASPSDDLPDYAPVPPSAVGPALNEFGYHVGHIGGPLFWVTEGFSQAMFLTTPEGVVLCDFPPTMVKALPQAIAEVTRANGMPSRVTHLIYSHSHADHIGAASILDGRITRIAHSETKRLLKAARDPNRPLPTVTFDDHYELRVGGERLELSFPGPNHSLDNIIIRVPEQSTVMFVDVVSPRWVPFKNLFEAQDVRGWMAAQDVLLATPWQTLVAGHVGRLGTRADVELQRDYVRDLAASARATIGALDPAPFVAKYGPTGNFWALGGSYLDAAAKLAAAPVTAKYLGELAAIDVFNERNMAAMVNFMRIDAGVLGPFGINP